MHGVQESDTTEQLNLPTYTASIIQRASECSAGDSNSMLWGSKWQGNPKKRGHMCM